MVALMKKSPAWTVSGVGPAIRDIAEEAADRAGMSVGEWLDEVIAETAVRQGVAPRKKDPDDDERRPAGPPENEDRGELRAAARERQDWDRPQAESRRPNPVSKQNPPARDEAAEAARLIDQAMAKVDARSQRQEQRTVQALESVTRWMQRADVERREGGRAIDALAERLSRIDDRLSRHAASLEAARPATQASADAMASFEQRMNDLARRLDGVERPRPRAPVSLGDAAAEIAKRREELDARAAGREKPPPPPRNVGLDAAPRAPAPKPEPPLSAPPPTAAASTAVDEALRLEIRKLSDKLEALRNEPASPQPATAAELNAVRAELAAMSRSVAELAPRNALVALEGAMRDLGERVSSLDNPEARRSLLAPVTATLIELRDVLRAQNPQSAVESLDRDIRAVSAKVEALAGAAVDRAAFDRIRQQVEDTRNLLLAAIARLAPPERLEKQIGALADRVERLSSNPRPEAETAQVIAALADLRMQIDRAAPTAVLASIETRLEQLAERIDRELSQPKRAAIFDMRAIDGLAERIEAVRKSVEERAVAPADTSRLEAALSDLSEKLDKRAQPTIDVKPLEQALKSLSQRPIHVDAGPLGDVIRDINDKLSAPRPSAALDTKPFEDLLKAFDRRWSQQADQTRPIAEMLAEINAKIDQGPSAPADITALESLIHDLGQRVDAQASTAIELKELHGRVGDLAEAMARSPAPPAAHEIADRAALTILRSLEARGLTESANGALAREVSSLHDRLDAIHATLPPRGALESVVGDLVGQLDATRKAIGALSDAQREIEPTYSAGLADLRADQAEIDRRMEDRLGRVHDVLERLIDRIESDAEESQRPDHAWARSAGTAAAIARAAARPQTPIEPSAPPLAPAADDPSLEEAENEATAFLVEPGLGAPRAAREAAASAGTTPRSALTDHIAAARRAAQAALAESARARGESARTPIKADASTSAAPAALEQAKAFFAARRRPILLGVALVALVAVAAIFTLRPHEATQVKSEVETPAPAASQAQAAPERGPMAVAGIDMTPTGAIAPNAATALGPPPSAAPSALPTTLVEDIPSATPSALREAVMRADAAAEYELAARLIDGRLGARDAASGAKWLEQAADQGLAPAQYRLATLYEKGVGVEKDIDHAKALYLKAAAAGNARAMHNLGVLTADSANGAKPNYVEAAEWFRKAGKLGVKDSQFNLGILEARGLGVPQDLGQAWLWFSLAAAQGDTDAGKKRDDVAARMDPAALAAAAQALSAFRLETPNPTANDVAPPPSGWDVRPAAPSAAAKPAGDGA